jgi:two-component system, OmpR family, sensor histidine kinase KdpD
MHSLMSRSRAVSARDLCVLGGGFVITAVTVAVLRRLPAVSHTTVALALLLIVLGTASVGKLWIATLVAMVATPAFNFFFLPPVGTFTIADPHNWIALLAFLAAAVIASHLSSSAQARAREAIERRNEVTRLFDLTRDVLLTTDTSGAMDALARQVARRFELSKVAICLRVEGGWQLHQGTAEPVRVATDVLDDALRQAREVLECDADRRACGGYARVVGDSGELVIVSLRNGGNAVGLLAVASSLDVGTLHALAGVVAIAIERAHFLAEREAADRLRQKAELASTLLASLSHDLKTPLTAVRVAVENLRNDLGADERRTQSAAAIVELERLNRLFQDILDMARIDAAAIHVEQQWVTPADVVDAALAQVRHATEGRPVRVEAEAEMQVKIDPRVASVALSHVLENAAHYSPAECEIGVEARVEGDALSVSVTDHGAGLDPQEVAQVFERFYRGHRARQLAPGTGMGLAITRGLLAAIGGRVWAERPSDGGARFTILVPGQSRRLTLREQ